MNLLEKFEKGQEVYVITDRGLKKGTYEQMANFRLEHVTVRCDYFMDVPAANVFSTPEAARHWLLTGEPEVLPYKVTSTSRFDIGDHVFSINDGRVREETITSVNHRLGHWEYYTDAHGCACYFDDNPNSGFRTRAEAVDYFMGL